MRMVERPEGTKVHWELAVRGKCYLGSGCWQGMELGMM